MKELESELAAMRGESARSKITAMSSEVVDSNPYSRLMALKRMGIVDNYEHIRECRHDTLFRNRIASCSTNCQRKALTHILLTTNSSHSDLVRILNEPSSFESTLCSFCLAAWRWLALGVWAASRPRC